MGKSSNLEKNNKNIIKSKRSRNHACKIIINVLIFYVVYLKCQVVSAFK